MEKKEIYRSKNQILNDAYDRIAAEIHIKKQQKGYKTFLVTGCESGVGSTTVVISMATSMALAGWKTVLVDVDMRKREADKRLNEDVSKGLSDYLRNEAEYKEIVTKTNYGSLDYISSGNHSQNTVSLLCSSRMKELLEELKMKYDYIIIDIPAMSSAVDASVLATISDAVIMVAAQLKTAKKTLKNAMYQLERVNANVLGVVVNRVEEDEYRRVMKNYDYFRKRKYSRKKHPKQKKA